MFQVLIYLVNFRVFGAWNRRFGSPTRRVGAFNHGHGSGPTHRVERPVSTSWSYKEKTLISEIAAYIRVIICPCGLPSHLIIPKRTIFGCKPLWVRGRAWFSKLGVLNKGFRIRNKKGSSGSNIYTVLVTILR